MAYAVAFSPDGQRIAAPTEKNVVTVWSASTGAEVWRLHGQDEVFSTAFSPDGRLLAVGGAYGFIDIWDTRNGKRHRTLGRRAPPVASLAFSNTDGQRLAAAGFDNTVSIWDVESRRELRRFVVDTKQANGAVFSADNQRLATCGFDRAVKLWDPQTGQEVLTFRDFTNNVQCVAFSHHSRYLAACSSDGTLRLWDGTPQSPEEARDHVTMQQPAAVVATISLHPDGRRLASAGEGLAAQRGNGAPIFVWDTTSGGTIQTLEGHEVYVFQVMFSPDGRFLASSGDDIRAGHLVRVWDTATGQRAFSTEPFEGEGVLFCLAYSPGGQYLLAGSQDGRILVWNSATGQKAGILGESNAAMFNLVFSPNGRHLASATQTGTVQLWDGDGLNKHQTNAFVITKAVSDLTDTLAFTPDSTQLLVAADDRFATIWDLESRTEVGRLTAATAHGIRALAVSPDGRWIASGGMDAKINLWHAETATLRKTLRGHKGEVTRLTFLSHPNGLRLISGARDGTVKVWGMGLLKRQ